MLEREWRNMRLTRMADALDGLGGWEGRQEPTSQNELGESCQAHATFTEEETLFALWIWTGKIKGRYWFRGYSEDDCPLEN